VKKVPHVGIEYAILLPILVLQIIVLPLAASWMMGVWTNDRMQAEIQEAANQVAGTIKQLYLALESSNISPNPPPTKPVVQMLNLPTTIESHAYYATSPRSGNYAILNLHFVLQGTGITANSLAIFGSSVHWNSSEFFSNSSSAYIKAWKCSNGTISLSFS
jgi:hypothetical protein